MRFPKNVSGIGVILILVLSFIAFIGIVLLVANFLDFNLSIFGLPAAGISGTVLSIQQTTLQHDTIGGLSNNTIWRVFVRYSGGGEQLYGGTLRTPSEILETSSNSSIRPLRVDFELTRQTVDYPLTQLNLQPQPQRIVGRSVTIVPTLLNGCLNPTSGLIATRTQSDGARPILVPTSCAPAYSYVCINNGGIPLQVQYGANNDWGLVNTFAATGMVCVTSENDPTNRVTYYRPTTRTVNFETLVLVSNGIETETLTPSVSQPVVYSTDRKVRAALDPGSTVSSTSYAPGIGAFRYVTMPSLSNPFTSVQTEFTPSAASIDSLQEINSYTNPELEEARDSEWPSFELLGTYQQGVEGYNQYIVNRIGTNQIFNSLIDTFSVSGGVLSVDKSSTPILFPEVRLDIVADFLGILRPQSDPIIESINPREVTIREAGTPENVEVIVKNNGPRATVVFGVDCIGGVLLSGLPVGQTYNTGERITNRFTVNAQNPGTYTCTVRVSDTENENIDMDTFTVRVLELCTLTVPSGTGFTLDAELCRLDCSENVEVSCSNAGLTFDGTNCRCGPPISCQEGGNNYAVGQCVDTTRRCSTGGNVILDSSCGSTPQTCEYQGLVYANGACVTGANLRCQNGQPAIDDSCGGGEDLCNNIDGIQSTVPEGNTRTSEGQCVDTSEQPTPPSIDPLTIVLVIFVSLVMAGAVAYLWVTSKRRN